MAVEELPGLPCVETNLMAPRRHVLLLLLSAFLPHTACDEGTSLVEREDAVEQLRFAVTDDQGFVQLPPDRNLSHTYGPSWRNFDEYRRSTPPGSSSQDRRIVVLPLGEFSSRDREIVDRAIALAGIWFHSETDGHPIQPLPDHARRRVKVFAGLERTVEQFHTGWFISRWLPPRRPEDATCVAAITMADLYPEDDWNYLLGVGSPEHRATILSFARFSPRFWGEPEDSETGRMRLKRSLRLMVHELGHVFGLRHCTTWRCAMNAANSTEEMDASPLHLCPHCLRMLQWNRRFDVSTRYRRLAAFFDTEGLIDDAAWFRRRVDLLEREARR